MNKRIKKKVNKRLGCKTYSGYREKLIVKLVSKYIDLDSDSIIYITKSRNGKRVLKIQIQILKNVIPYIPNFTNQYNNKLLDCEFVGKPFNNEAINELSEFYRMHMQEV